MRDVRTCNKIQRSARRNCTEAPAGSVAKEAGREVVREVRAKEKGGAFGEE